MVTSHFRGLIRAGQRQARTVTRGVRHRGCISIAIKACFIIAPCAAPPAAVAKYGETRIARNATGFLVPCRNMRQKNVAWYRGDAVPLDSIADPRGIRLGCTAPEAFSATRADAGGVRCVLLESFISRYFIPRYYLERLVSEDASPVCRTRCRQFESVNSF